MGWRRQTPLRFVLSFLPPEKELFSHPARGPPRLPQQSRRPAFVALPQLLTPLTEFTAREGGEKACEGTGPPVSAHLPWDPGSGSIPPARVSQQTHRRPRGSRPCCHQEASFCRAPLWTPLYLQAGCKGSSFGSWLCQSRPQVWVRQALSCSEQGGARSLGAGSQRLPWKHRSPQAQTLVQRRGPDRGSLPPVCTLPEAACPGAALAWSPSRCAL